MTDFWAGRRVLLTGHTGFKGGWLALWLGELGAQVTGFAAPPPTEPALYALARVGEALDDVRGDVLSGVIGAMLAKGLAPAHAACAGVYAHLRAGQIAAAPHGADGVIASDVIHALPAALSA